MAVFPAKEIPWFAAGGPDVDVVPGKRDLDPRRRQGGVHGHREVAAYEFRLFEARCPHAELDVQPAAPWPAAPARAPMRWERRIRPRPPARSAPSPRAAVRGRAPGPRARGRRRRARPGTARARADRRDTVSPARRCRPETGAAAGPGRSRRACAPRGSRSAGYPGQRPARPARREPPRSWRGRRRIGPSP